MSSLSFALLDQTFLDDPPEGVNPLVQAVTLFDIGVKSRWEIGISVRVGTTLAPCLGGPCRFTVVGSAEVTSFDTEL